MSTQRTRPATSTGTLRQRARRVLVAIAGAALALLGLLLVPAPGPGWLIVFAGLAVLATEFEWARRLEDRLTARLRRVGAPARRAVPAWGVAAGAGLALTAGLTIALASGLRPQEVVTAVTDHVRALTG